MTAEPSCKDEARIGQQGTLTRVWARRGTRPRAPRDQRYKWAYIFRAVCPQRRTTAALVLPAADTNAMSMHLAEISRRVAPGAHAVLVIVARLSWRSAPRRSIQHHARSPAAIRSRAEPDRECLGISAR